MTRRYTRGMTFMTRCLIAAALFAPLAACGNKGPLVLADKAPVEETAVAAPAAAAPTDAAPLPPADPTAEPVPATDPQDAPPADDGDG